MVISSFVKEMGKKMMLPAIMLAIIYIALAFLPKKSLLTINLTILTVVLANKLITSLLLKKKPIIKDWIKTIISVVTFVTIFYYLIRFLGGYGVIGLIIIILLFVTYRIIKGWKLYKYTCVWVSDMIKGKRRRFDTNEFTDKEEQKK